MPAGLRAQDRGLELVDVRFEGVRSVSDDSLRAAIVHRATGCKDPLFVPACLLGFARDRHYLQLADIAADELRLRLYYYERGYREATAHARVDTLRGGQARLVFRVDEGRPVRVATIELDGAPPELPRVARALPLREGEPFALLRYETSRDSLVARLRNVGYAFAEVLAGYTIPSDSPSIARVRYELIPGARARFGPIEVIGASRVDPELVRRMLTFDTGDVYRERDLLESRRTLFALELFRHADIRPRLDLASDSVVPVTVQVNEGDVHRLRFGAGLNSADCANAEGRWVSRNFFGGARRLELRARVSNVLAEQVGGFPCSQTGDGRYDDVTGSLAMDFAQPWFFGPAHSLGGGLFLERQSFPDLFVRTSRGGYVSLTRAPGTRSSLALAFRPALTDLDASDNVVCVSFVLCDAADIALLREPHWLAPLTVSFVRDRANALFAPTRGYILRLEAEHASGVTGSDFGYNRLLGEVSWYSEPRRGVVVATRVRPGWARAAERAGVGLHPQKRFFAGGPSSVRGFAQNRLGPKVLSIDAHALLTDTTAGRVLCTVETVNDGSCSASGIPDEAFDVRPTGGNASLEGNVELRFPLAFDRLRGAAFVDYGQVWTRASDFGLQDLVFTPGLGIRFFSPAGPIRVDVGYNAGGAERLNVITTELDADGGKTGALRTLDAPVFWKRDSSFFDRLQLHFSIGQAF